MAMTPADDNFNKQVRSLAKSMHEYADAISQDDEIVLYASLGIIQVICGANDVKIEVLKELFQYALQDYRDFLERKKAREQSEAK